VAVKRLANVAVFGEAPEDLLFTLTDVDRAVNFSARTIGGCTSERTPARRRTDAMARSDADGMGRVSGRDGAA
jgi:hypothetical protein